MKKLFHQALSDPIVRLQQFCYLIAGTNGRDVKPRRNRSTVAYKISMHSADMHSKSPCHCHCNGQLYSRWSEWAAQIENIIPIILKKKIQMFSIFPTSNLHNL